MAKKDLNLFDLEITAPPPREQYIQSTIPGVIERAQQSHANRQKTQESRQQIKRIIEALLFSSPDPLGFMKLREILESAHPLKPRQLRDLILELQFEYLSQKRSFRLEEIPEGFILRTCEEFCPYVDLLFRNKRTEKLSNAAAEVLAIIAYKQPITRPQIEAIRGVDSTGIVQSLLDRQLIETIGRLEKAPGRPALLGVTQKFLAHFGLKERDDLPPIEELMLAKL